MFVCVSDQQEAETPSQEVALLLHRKGFDCSSAPEPPLQCTWSAHEEVEHAHIWLFEMFFPNVWITYLQHTDSVYWLELTWSRVSLSPGESGRSLRSSSVWFCPSDGSHSAARRWWTRIRPATADATHHCPPANGNQRLPRGDQLISQLISPQRIQIKTAEGQTIETSSVKIIQLKLTWKKTTNKKKIGNGKNDFQNKTDDSDILFWKLEMSDQVTVREAERSKVRRRKHWNETCCYGRQGVGLLRQQQ